MLYLAVVLILVIAGLVFSKRTKKQEDSDNKTKENISIEKIDSPKTITTTILKDGERIKGKVIIMPQGLQVFDQNGNIILDVTDRICKILGTLDTGFSDGTIQNPEIKAGMTIWAIAIKTYRNKAPYRGNKDDVIYSTAQYRAIDGGISWNFTGGTNGNEYKIREVCFYGVY